MKKILIVVNSLSGGGAEKSMSLLGKEMRRRNWNVNYITLDPKDSSTTNVTAVLNRKKSLLQILLAFIKVQFLITRTKPDYILLNCSFPEFMFAPIVTKSKIIVIDHAPFPWKGKEMVGFVIRKILTLRKVEWVQVSEHFKTWGVTPKTKTIIPNSIDFVSDSVHEMKIFTNISRLVFIGRLSTEKNPELLINVAQFTNLPILYIGQGSLHKKLHKLSVEKKIICNFTGYVKNPWLEINESDLIVIPSFWEGDSLVASEAIALRRPLILRDIPDFRRFNLNSYNYAKDINEFIEKINQSSNNISIFLPDDTISNNLRKSRSLDEIATRWESFLSFN